MRPDVKSDRGQQDFFRSRLDQILNMKHPLIVLSQIIDWPHLEATLAPYYSSLGRRGIAIRLMLGLHFLKYIYRLSDESICYRWEENPYFQYFCGESFFQHGLPIERSSLSHFRDRIDEQVLEKLLQSSLSSAYKLGALSLKDLRRVAIDTTVQEKAISHPTEAGLLSKALQKLTVAAQRFGIKVRQTYKRVVRGASIMAGRYLHARQMKRARKKIKFIRTRVHRLIRDVKRKAEEQFEKLPEALEKIVERAERIANQKRGDPFYQYSWHAPEVECIGKGKARKAYEFGCKVALSTQLRVSKGCKHFILSAQALTGRPYDGHTVGQSLEQLESILGCAPDESYVDKGYRGHGSQHRTRVIVSGQKRGVTSKIKQNMKRRSVIEPIIGHAKNDGHLGRHWLKGTKGDQINTCFSAIGFNLRQMMSFLNTQRQITTA